MNICDLFNYDEKTGYLYFKNPSGKFIKAGYRVKSLDKQGYLRVGIDGQRYFAHRIVWQMFHGSMPDGMLDHINDIKTDNRIENLRLSNACLNGQNRRFAQKNNVCGLLGVTALKSGKYSSRINIGGVLHYLGSFADKHEAHQVYLKAKRKFHKGCTI